MISNFACCWAVADLPAGAGTARDGSWRLFDRDVVFLLHALDQLFDQLLESFHPSAFAADCSRISSSKQVTLQQRLFDGASGRRACARHPEARSTCRSESRSAADSPREPEQILHAHLAADLVRTWNTDAFHRKSAVPTHGHPMIFTARQLS